MQTHKYRVGQTLKCKRPGFIGGGVGEVKIERLLPANPTENQYQVQSLPDGQRRVVGESEISR
jgi:hypothetical protein